MTPHQIELVKKLDQEVQNLSILMQHTEVGDSLTLKDIRHYLYLLNKEVKVSQEPNMRTFIEDAHLFQKQLDEYTKKCIEQYRDLMLNNTPPK